MSAPLSGPHAERRTRIHYPTTGRTRCGRLAGVVVTTDIAENVTCSVCVAGMGLRAERRPEVPRAD